MGAFFGVSAWRWHILRPLRLFIFVLDQRERKVFFGLTALLILSLAGLLVRGYIQATEIAPAVGGTYTEGLVGQPRLINPLFVATNDVDRDLGQLIFSGLMKYAPDGSLVPDLAERYEVSPDGKTYTFSLRNGITWHDGEAFSADDVIFTLSLVQSPLVQSPVRTNWQGVKVEKLDEKGVQFTLVTPYTPFLENTTLGILPKHLWEKVPLEGLRLAELNLQPVGTGPYSFGKFRKDSFGGIHSFTLRRFAEVKPTPAHLGTIVFRFFGLENDLVKAFKTGEIDGFVLSTSNLLDKINKNGANGTEIHTVTLTLYYAVFFNQTRSKVLADKTVRQALRDATNTEEIIDTLLAGKGTSIHGPIPPGLPGFTDPDGDGAPHAATASPDDRFKDALARLERNGWKDADGDGIREKTFAKEKTATPLAFTLATSDSPDLRVTAEIIKKQWGELGGRVDLQFYPLPDLERNILRPRQYDALLFGEFLNLEPDPYTFWHSKDKRDPGLNLALYENRAVDKLLEEARQTLEKEKRVAKLQEFSKLIQEDIPAVFLYTPQFLYLQPREVKGFGMRIIALPSHRFADVTGWYVKTERAWKR